MCVFFVLLKPHQYQKLKSLKFSQIYVNRQQDPPPAFYWLANDCPMWHFHSCPMWHFHSCSRKKKKLRKACCTFTRKWKTKINVTVRTENLKRFQYIKAFYFKASLATTGWVGRLHLRQLLSCLRLPPTLCPSQDHNTWLETWTGSIWITRGTVCSLPKADQNWLLWSHLWLLM